jgi:cytochrome c peroxidase
MSLALLLVLSAAAAQGGLAVELTAQERAQIEKLSPLPPPPPDPTNAAASPPYMHAGQLATLHEVVLFYSTRAGASNAGHHQEITLLPLNLGDAEIDDLVAFLESLRGAPLDPALLTRPASPLANKR